MKTVFRIALFLFVLGFFACNTNSKKDIPQLEKELYDQSETSEFNKPIAEKLLEEYTAFVTTKPDDPLAPMYTYKGAEIARTLGKYTKALELYRRLYEKHPDYEKAPQALFLQGFTYENDLGELEKAKALYQEFIQKFPNHELAQSVKFSIENLGKAPGEIIKEFESTVDSTKLEIK